MLIPKSYYRYRIDNPGSSVNSREKVYDINREYALIRDRLTADPALWERFKGAYWKRAYISYVVTVQRIAPEYRAEYIAACREELRGAQERGELDLSLFPPQRKQLVELLLEDPARYQETMEALDRYRDFIAPGRIRMLDNKRKAAERRCSDLEEKDAKLERRLQKVTVQRDAQREQLQQNDAEIHALKKKITALKKRVRTLRNSSSYRIGRFVTWPVRKLRGR